VIVDNADAFHQGHKPWPLVVESGADVLVELVLWVRLPELFDLSLEVRCLLRARDSGVDDLGLALLTIFTTEERIDVMAFQKFEFFSISLFVPRIKSYNLYKENGIRTF
jgi:hypothetical protein